MRRREIEFEFVEFIPSERTLGTFYISIEYATVVHDCLCGCGQKVVTPLNPTGWELSFDGETISLDPSIGNWSFTCRSHYIIRRNRIIWAGDMTREQIERGRRRDQALRRYHFDGVSTDVVARVEEEPAFSNGKPPKRGGFLRKWLRW